MRFGVTMFMTDQTMGPVDLARAAEERGLHSLYIPEHTHIPTSRLTPPATGDAELREEYKRTLDPFVALSMAAAATERLTVGTGICLVAQREPIVTAKAIATLDQQSGGRFVLGIGFGWNEDEIADHGVTMADRRAVTREHVLAMRALWTDDVASYDGEFVHISPSWSWPKPVRPGGPPVLIGGAPGPKLFAHVTEYADGWIPIGGAGIRAALPDLHRACEAAGRDPATLQIVPFGTVPDAGKLEYYESIGVTEVVLRVAGGDAERVLPILDEYAPLVGSLVEQLREDWQRALAVVAHPDDLEYGAASAIARWTGQGKQVTYLLATRGEAGIDALPPAECARVREAEERASAAEVGVTQVEFLDHTDGLVEYGIPLRRDIALVIRRIRPQVVLTINHHDTFGGSSFNMADHRHVGLAVIDAVRDAANRWVFTDASGDEPWSGVEMILVNGSPAASHFVDVTDTLERGIASLERHAAYLAHVGQDARAFLTSSAAGAGRECGVPYATTFEVLAP